MKDVFQLVDEIASAIFKFVGLLLAIVVGLVVIGVGIETFSIEKTTKFISNLFSNDDKINISYTKPKSNNKSLYEIEEVEEVKSIFDDSYDDDSYDSVFETDVGLIHCPDGINEICHDDYGKEYDKHGPNYFVRIDNAKYITIFEQVE